MRRFDGTLHIGNLCNNNYKLTMSLRAIGVDARILFERVIAQNAVSDPADYDSQFDPPHADGLRSAPWCQSKHPMYVQSLTRNFSSYSTGSNLRDDYYGDRLRDRLLRRGYRRSVKAFHHNVDLWNYELASKVSYSLLPNVVDFSKFHLTTASHPMNACGSSCRVATPTGKIRYQGTSNTRGGTSWRASGSAMVQRLRCQSSRRSSRLANS